MSGAKCTVTAIGCLIPQQGVIQRGIDRFQRVTDIVVTAARYGISRCSDTAVCIHHSVPAQSIGNVVTNAIKLRTVNGVATGGRDCTVCNISDYTGIIINAVFGAEFTCGCIPE